jgi:hypothetical protein
MKQVAVRFVAGLSIAVIVFASSTLGAAKIDEVWFRGSTVDVIEKSLAMALRTPSPGMQASASQVIRDLKLLLPDQDFSLLIIPLMGIVKDEDAEVSVRMVAALALHDLQSGKGDFAIQRVAQFTKNERMKHHCLWLTYERVMKSPSVSNTTATLND